MLVPMPMLPEGDGKYSYSPTDDDHSLRVLAMLFVLLLLLLWRLQHWYDSYPHV
jgi:hypothetical protein